MSYLLVQILVCLLIAGLIGLVIGWFLRGGCDKKLKESERYWTDKFNAHDNSLRNKHQGLMLEQESNIEHARSELSILKNKLTLMTSKNQELNNQNLHLLTDKNQLEIDYTEKIKSDEVTWKRRINGLMSQNSLNEENLKKELSNLENKFSVVEKREAELENKLKSSEVSWKSKIQGLMSQDTSNKTQAEEELISLKLQLQEAKSVIEKSENNEIKFKELEEQLLKEKSESNASKNKLFSSNNEFNTNLEKIKKEHRDAMAQKEAMILSLQQRITATENEIEEFKKDDDSKNKD